MRVLIASLIGLLATQGAGFGAAIVDLSVSRVSFDTVAVFETNEQVVEVRNTGDAELTVTDILPTDAQPTFAASPSNFSVAQGDSQAVTVRFSPVQAGSHISAVVIESNGDVPGSGLAGLLLSGVATGPRLEPSLSTLVFESPVLGVGKAVTVSLANDGNETLAVTDISAGDTRFSVGSTQLTLAPGASTTLQVTFTPDASAPVTDSLQIVSDDPVSPSVSLALVTEETPVNVRNARVALALIQGTLTPVVGDTVAFSLTASANGDTLTGAEVFLRYDATALVPIDAIEPAATAGFTQGLEFLINRTEGSGLDGIVHFSATFNKSKTTTDTLATVAFLVQNPLQDVRTVRVLTEAPLVNSQFSRPDGLSFTLPGANRIQIGNAPPVVTAFPIVEGEEDGSGDIGVNGFVSDPETADNDVVWTFSDVDELGVVSSISTPSPQAGQVARLFSPEDAFGLFRVLARATDGAGASDSVIVLLDVAPTNDPPFAPVYTSPTDESADLGTPIEFRWTGSDPDAGDSLTYEFRFGPNSDTLPVAATGLTAPEFVVTTPSPGEPAFWQVVVRDEEGLTQEGPVFQFTFAEDQTPPAFVAEPVIGTVTPVSATISWQTTETAEGRVRLATTWDLSDSTSFDELAQTDLALSQTVEADGLTPDLTYYFRVVIADAFGNQLAGDILSFTTVEPNAGDLNNDLVVDFDDFLQFSNSFGLSTGDSGFEERSDFNNDGAVNFTDFLTFARLFGTTYGTG